MSRVLWRSWSRYEAEWELKRLKNLPLINEWQNAHLVTPTEGDIWLTTNGYDFRPGFRNVSWYAESYIYNRPEYDRYPTENRWTHRFHFNPTYYSLPGCSFQGIHCWWKNELEFYDSLKHTKKIEHVFGMCQGKKPIVKSHDADIGWFRTRIVEGLRRRNFKYFGTNWPHGDRNYHGEAYVNGSRGDPTKFSDARRLMAGAKFVFAAENIYHEVFSVNYLTEKIFHGFLSRSVPIYIGCWNIQELINPNLFIDVRKFNMDIKAIADFCEKMPDTEYRGYLDRIEEFLHGEGQKFSCDSRFLEVDAKLKALFG